MKEIKTFTWRQREREEKKFMNVCGRSQILLFDHHHHQQRQQRLQAWDCCNGLLLFTFTTMRLTIQRHDRLLLFLLHSCSRYIVREIKTVIVAAACTPFSL